MIVNVPLEDLLCRQCRKAPDIKQAPSQAGIEYAVVPIRVDVPTESMVSTVALPLERLELRRLGSGRYHAYAIVEVPCPECAEMQALRYYFAAMRIIVAEVGWCEKCDKKLVLEEESLVYAGQDDNGPRLQLICTLACPECCAKRLEKADCLLPEGSGLWMEYAVNLVVGQSKAGMAALSKPGVRSEVKGRLAVAFCVPETLGEYASQVRRLVYDQICEGQVFGNEEVEIVICSGEVDSDFGRTYAEGSDLLVVFLRTGYDEERWGGLDWCVVRDLIRLREGEGQEVMLVCLGEVEIPRPGARNEYVSVDANAPCEAATLILDRLAGGGSYRAR